MKLMMARIEKLCELLGVDGAAALRRYRGHRRIRELVNQLLGGPVHQREHGTCYTRAQAARMLGVVSKTVKRWIADGRIFDLPGVNGERLIPASEIRRVAAERKGTPKRKYTKRDKRYWGIA